MIFNGDRDGTTHQRSLDVSAHVVRPFKRMNEVGSTVGNQFIEESLEIVANIWICVLIDSQSRRSMFDKDHQQTTFGKCRQLGNDVTRDQMKSA